MRIQKSLLVAALAGCTGLAAANPQVMRVQKYRAQLMPTAIQHMTSGVTVANGTHVSRDAVIAYDNDTLDGSAFGMNTPYTRGGAYTSAGTGSESLFVLALGTTAGTLPFGFGDGLAPEFFDDNGTPDNPNDDFSYLTDVMFDDYTADPALYGNLNQRQLATFLTFNTVHINTSVDDNGTPDNPNDDFPIPRPNTAIFNFWGINDNGTPGNPNDDFLEYVDGVGLTYGFGAGAIFIYSFGANLSGLPDGGLMIPGQGIVGFDWANAAPNGDPKGDNGVFAPLAGGDGDVTGVFSGQATGFPDGIPIPEAESLTQVGSNAANVVDGFWLFGSSLLIDPGADGDPSDTTYTDILFGPYTVFWIFAGDTGQPGSEDMEFAAGMPIGITWELTANPCPADLTGSSDPNDPSYGVPDGNVDASDFFYYLDQFVAGNLAVADLTGSSDPNDPAYGVPDGVVDASDFFFYLDIFVAGCP
ncbi:MAG: hypothetical protein KIT24_09800 [Phycisphaeraceae bacterium]|nr:hypothetical protein [Phycisphaeraceae bacterium]